MPKKVSFTPSGKVIEDLTTTEVNAIASDRTKSNERLKALKDAADKKAVDAASGNTKLLNLGLTQDEATALTGYKP
jgi:hypothetical protein